jgi:exportin-5
VLAVTCSARKQFVEVLLLSCPSTLYPSHVSPLLGPLFEHMQYRLQLTWAPILNAAADRNSTLLTAPLNVSTCAAASSLAAKKDGNWYATFYARGGLFVGDLEAVSAESVVEKVRVDLTRGYCDMLQSALALRGEW